MLIQICSEYGPPTPCNSLHQHVIQFISDTISTYLKTWKKKSQVSIREFPVPWWVNISQLTTLQKSNCCCESMNLTDYLLHRNRKLQVKLLVTLTINLGWNNQLICELIYFSWKTPNKTVSNLIIIKCSNNLSIVPKFHYVTSSSYYTTFPSTRLDEIFHFGATPVTQWCTGNH